MGYTTIDMVGQKCGMLTVLEHVGHDKKHQALFRCVCECGNYVVKTGTSLRRGECKSCGCLQKEKASKIHSKDYTGSRIGLLTVLGIAGYKINKNGEKHKQYLVQCDCGNQKIVSSQLLGRKNPIYSCGCATSNIIEAKHSQDITGQVFGRLTAIQPTRTNNNKHGWLCRCLCGNNVVTTITKLRSGHTTSCGCLHIDRTRKNITGQKFGLLTVIDIAYSDKNNVYWNCICDCGERCIVNGTSLRSETTISCGCIRSKGENIIKSFLDKYQIHYYREKKFNGCMDIGMLKYDFWLPDYGICIEFDGIQHYQNTSSWDKASTLDDRQRRDAIKTKYCEENDIILLRIPYWEKDNIESILTDWLFLYNDEEAGDAR